MINDFEFWLLLGFSGMIILILANVFTFIRERIEDLENKVSDLENKVSLLDKYKMSIY